MTSLGSSPCQIYVQVLESQQLSGFRCKKLTFSVGSKYLLPGIYGSSKTNIPGSNFRWPCNSQLTINCQIKTKHNSIWSKALIMPLTLWNCVLSYKHKIFFSENQLAVPKNFFHNRIPRYHLFATQYPHV